MTSSTHNNSATALIDSGIGVGNTNNAHSTSFRSQLTKIVAAGILTLAVTTALTSAWVTTNNIRSQFIADGVQVTESLAEQSVLALLYASPENAEEASSAALGFPSITGVSILTPDRRPLLARGEVIAVVAGIKPATRTALLVENSFKRWTFMAPVYSSTHDGTAEGDMLSLPARAPELLGYVLVNKSKEKLNEVLIDTIVNNLVIGLIIAMGFIFVIRRAFSRLMTPVDRLTQVMSLAEQGNAQVRAEVDGPKEVAKIARAFNKMIEALAERDAQLRSHNELLEYEVAERTQDLVYARDMAVQANRNKSSFLSSVSHELRTPLQGIIGYSDLLLDSLPHDMPGERHDIETILKNAQHLLTMINSILDIAKIESGRITIESHPTQLLDLIENITQTVRPMMDKNQNQFDTELYLQDSEVIIDDAKLRQSILNLLSNAAKFTHQGHVLLKITQQHRQLIINVEDTGIGLQAEDLIHIFEPFYQADSGITRHYQGTGLGLAITKQFCLAMGGDVTVTSQPGKGSCFTITLPLKDQDSARTSDI
ncbi:MAG: HAMP domain-containing protein [Gammaproteobacteria bacterium]|nr:HAMP domain-containing protein [Gammaproteobacteria bacterium]